MPDKQTKWLITTLLKKVSRSFYLSLRFLPSSLRTQLSLAYLLARATDTIADTKELSIDIRKQQLTHLVQMIQSGHSENLNELIHIITPLQQNMAERELIKNLPKCLELLSNQNDMDKRLIINVISTITQGQLFDIDYFAKANAAVTRLESAEQLETYTYQVAGCVGEFWSRLCLMHLKNYSNLPEKELITLGINFGKGLQLTNILRDVPEDLKLGRLYLPSQKDTKPANTLSKEEIIQDLNDQHIYQHWRQQAYAYIDDGFNYLYAIKPKKIRFSCLMPLYLAVGTLNLLDNPRDLINQAKVKVSRQQVYKTIWKAILGSWSNKLAKRYYDSKHT